MSSLDVEGIAIWRKLYDKFKNNNVNSFISSLYRRSVKFVDDVLSKLQLNETECLTIKEQIKTKKVAMSQSSSSQSSSSKRKGNSIQNLPKSKRDTADAAEASSSTVISFNDDSKKTLHADDIILVHNYIQNLKTNSSLPVTSILIELKKKCIDPQYEISDQFTKNLLKVTGLLNSNAKVPDEVQAYMENIYKVENESLVCIPTDSIKLAINPEKYIISNSCLRSVDRSSIKHFVQIRRIMDENSSITVDEAKAVGKEANKLIDNSSGVFPRIKLHLSPAAEAVYNRFYERARQAATVDLTSDADTTMHQSSPGLPIPRPAQGESKTLEASPAVNTGTYQSPTGLPFLSPVQGASTSVGPSPVVNTSGNKWLGTASKELFPQHFTR